MKDGSYSKESLDKLRALILKINILSLERVLTLERTLLLVFAIRPDRSWCVPGSWKLKSEVIETKVPNRYRFESNLSTNSSEFGDTRLNIEVF